MRAYESMNPAAVAVHLLLTACITIFCMEPILLMLSLLSSIAFFVIRNGRKHVGFHALALGIPALFAIINPLWNQHGSSVLFILNDRAITAEALFYGAVTGIRLAAVLYWFRCFSDLMTSEKLFYLFRFLSPQLALLFSMAVRNLTVFRQQMRKIQDAQRALGLYREGHLIDDVRGGLRVFSILLTWALENGIITANSMSARGYGCGKRSSFVYFRWNPADLCLLFITILLTAMVMACLLGGGLTWQFYPEIVLPSATLSYFCGLSAYAVLVILPLIHEGWEAMTWYRLRSKI